MEPRAEIWLLDARLLSAAALESSRALLGASEAARYTHFVRRERQTQFVLGRALLRRSAGRMLGVPPAAFEVTERPGQAPLLALAGGRRSAPFFSLSHSGPWIACALSGDTALGLDLEVIDPARDVAALALQAFDGAELALFEAAPQEQRLALFYRLWSRKEARLKLGDSATAHHLDLPHAGLSIALCSALPLAAAPVIAASMPEA